MGGGGWGCFFFNDTATTEIYTLSLHDALPICRLVGELEPREIMEEMGRVEELVDGFEREVFL